LWENIKRNAGTRSKLVTKRPILGNALERGEMFWSENRLFMSLAMESPKGLVGWTKVAIIEWFTEVEG
jgi:hypothetical protein